MKTICPDRTYNVYQQNIHEIDMYYHVHTWRKLLEQQLGCPLEGDDYLFPYVAKNGIPHPDRAMSYQKTRELLNEFTTAAGLPRQYSTHCFRRGGCTVPFHVCPNWPALDPQRNSLVGRMGRWGEGECFVLLSLSNNLAWG